MPHKDHLLSQLRDCTTNLTYLSVLQPQLPHRGKKISNEVTLQSVTEFVRSHTKKKEILEIVPLVWQLAHHQGKLHKLRLENLDNELAKCHKRLDQHTQFVLKLIAGIENVFREFERNSLAPVLTEPLSSLLSCYSLLQEEQTNEQLAVFFQHFDKLAPALQHSVKLLRGSLKVENISELEKLLKHELYTFTRDCLKARNAAEHAIIDEDKEHQERKTRVGKMLEK
eukprot:sb/3469622/